MNSLLYREFGGSGFRTPHQLAATIPAQLKRKCRVGYRAQRIVGLARRVTEGKIDLEWFEHPHRYVEELMAALLKIHGIGLYAAASLCQLLGHYDHLAIDTETRRHYLTHIRRAQPASADDLRRLDREIEQHYAPHGSYRFLAYWFELWQTYEKQRGKRSDRWSEPDTDSFTTAQLGTSS